MKLCHISDKMRSKERKREGSNSLNNSLNNERLENRYATLYKQVKQEADMSEITREEAFELLKKYNKDPFHIQHALTVEAVMKWFARELGYEDCRQSRRTG